MVNDLCVISLFISQVQIQSFYGDHPFIVKAHYFWQAKQSLYIGQYKALCMYHFGIQLYRYYHSFHNSLPDQMTMTVEHNLILLPRRITYIISAYN